MEITNSVSLGSVKKIKYRVIRISNIDFIILLLGTYNSYYFYKDNHIL